MLIRGNILWRFLFQFVSARSECWVYQTICSVCAPLTTYVFHAFNICSNIILHMFNISSFPPGRLWEAIGALWTILQNHMFILFSSVMQAGNGCFPRRLHVNCVQTCSLYTNIHSLESSERVPKFVDGNQGLY